LAEGVAALALVVYAILCVFVWPEESWRPEWDSALYLLLGQALASGEGYTYLGQPFFLRPPGLPVLISFFVEDGQVDVPALLRLLMASAALFAVVLYAALRCVVGPWIALAVTALAATALPVARSFHWVLAELPFLALPFGAIACLERSGRRGPRWWTWAIAGALLLAASLHLRGAGLVLVPGMLLPGFRSDRGRQRWRPLLALGLLVAAMTPWWITSSRLAAEAPRPSEQLLAFDYTTALLHVDPGNPDSPRIGPAELGRRIRQNAPRFASELGRNALGRHQPLGTALWLAAAAGGFVLALRRGPTLFEWFAVAYSALLLAYYEFDPRLAAPLTPLPHLYALGALTAAVAYIQARARPQVLRRALGVVPVLVFAALLGVNLARLPRYLDPVSPSEGSVTQGDSVSKSWTPVVAWANFESVGTWLREHTEPDAVLLCNQAPILSYLSGRTAYTYRFVRKPDLIGRTGAEIVVLDGPMPQRVLEETRARALRSWTLQPTGVRVVAVWAAPPGAPSGSAH
jgi:4-amino-4-deoxy-L-arabinose transferase-like glycosyltransferase